MYARTPSEGLNIDNLTRYLSNPLRAGVYYGRFQIDFGEKVTQLLKGVADIAKKHKVGDWEELARRARSYTTAGAGSKLSLLSETIEHISVAIYHLSKFEECPKEILDYAIPPKIVAYFKEKRKYTIPKEAYFRKLAFSPPRRGKLTGVFTSKTMVDISDVIAIDIEETEDLSTFLLEASSTKRKGLQRFERFVRNIPHLGNTIKGVRKRKTHSSRYAFRPYPLAVKLWLGSEKAGVVPKDLKDFLKVSTRYYSNEEWRTSIVLSAIAVESVLADLYEEKYKEYAPSVPLGDLYHKVKDKVEFPQYIKNAIEMVNDARISAVHRSRFPVGSREAIKALYGFTTFTMWFSSNF